MTLSAQGSSRSGSSAEGFPPAIAATIATTAYAGPYLLSRSTTPTPDHPKVFLWYRLLDQPAIKPPDIAIPIAWLAIESGLAFAGYRLLREAPSRVRTRALMSNS